MDINQVNLLGNVAKEPEFRKTNSGDKVVNFTIITNETWKDKETKEKKEEAEFHNIVFWNYPDFIENALKKGSRVLINNGKIKNSSWEHEGKRHYKTEIVINAIQGDVIILDKKEA